MPLKGANAAGMRRGQVNWFSYLMLGFFTSLLNIQGNILPFLQAELDLSYRAVSLHFSAIAIGMIVVGLFGHPAPGPTGCYRSGSTTC